MSQFTAFIFARGGSKGLPRKNLLPLAGKSLIAHAVETALASSFIRRVVVSTDSDEIADAAIRHGAEVPFMRPAQLAADDSPELDSWRHALDTLKVLGQPEDELFVSVPTTAPLRISEDIDACVRKKQAENFDVVLTVAAASSSPWFNMVTFGESGSVTRILESPQPAFRRQTVPACYTIVPACYVSTPGFVRQAQTLFQGTVGAVEIPRERAADVDDIVDFKIAEALWPLRNQANRMI